MAAAEEAKGIGDLTVNVQGGEPLGAAGLVRSTPFPENNGLQT